MNSFKLLSLLFCCLSIQAATLDFPLLESTVAKRGINDTGHNATNSSSPNYNNTTSYSNSTDCAATPNHKKEIYRFIDGFWQAFMNPNNTVEALKINSTYFTENSRGRVSLTRDFEGNELNTEYIFALFSNIFDVKFRMVGYGINYTINNFLVDDLIVYTSVTVMFYVAQVDYYIPMQIDFNTFLVEDPNAINGYRIDEYDAVFRNFDHAYNITNTYAESLLEKELILYPEFSSAHELYIYLAAESVCTVHEKYCNGTNLQYDTYDDCLEYLTTQVRLGEGYEGGMDSLFCRNLHQVMLPFRPAVHCPHIGPSGGDMCTDTGMAWDEVIDSYPTYFTHLFNANLY